MKPIVFIYFWMSLLAMVPVVQTRANMVMPADSAYLFSYAKTVGEGRSGLHFAWSVDCTEWHPIGPEHSFVKCDYGSWGSEKRMFSPVLFPGADGLWYAVWNLNNTDDAVACVTTRDMVYWGRQSYYADLADFSQFSSVWIEEERTRRQEILIMGEPETGSVNRVPWSIVDGLIKSAELAAYHGLLWNERAVQDPVRFEGLEPVEIAVTLHPERAKPISELLIGVFFEDINYAADGGLYAELIQNRDFEYDTHDKLGRDTSWHHTKAWRTEGYARLDIDTVSPIHLNNRHYAVLTTTAEGGKLVNEGWDGIPLTDGEKYDFSFFARTAEGRGGRVAIRLTGHDGTVYGETSLRVNSPHWKKQTAVITARGTVTDARLEIVPESAGSYSFDMVSLFPQNTFKGRKNGLRADLAQAIADINPRFVRFPGGCVAHGNGLENMYRWKNTIGPLEARVPQRNMWGYHQTAGLGYLEYFQFCEDIGAEPVPVVPAGVPCQNSDRHGHALGGQQGGIPMCEMDDYVQEVLDLIEWANGDTSTKWGRVRAESGHPEPFELKYLGVGNEDLITDVFEERFKMIFDAVREKHPEITVIGTVGPFFEGTDYVEGWRLATELGVPIVDEHYYNPPGWFIHNRDFYDRYDRSKPKVYLGEYAAHLPGRVSNIETALAEALFMTSLERNGDVVAMTSYTPLLAKEGNTQWSPDLIYFNNTEVKPTVNYYVQQLYGQNAGAEYIPHTATLSDRSRDVTARVGVSVVGDGRSGDIILKIVNMLPVEVVPSIDFGSLQIPGGDITKAVLSGAPEDTGARPVISTVHADEVSGLKLPPYSFTVLRLGQ